MKQNNVKVHHTTPTSWYNDVDCKLKEIYQKYGDILIDWQIVTNKSGELIIWYVLKDTDSVPNEPQIKI